MKIALALLLAVSLSACGTTTVDLADKPAEARWLFSGDLETVSSCLMRALNAEGQPKSAAAQFWGRSINHAVVAVEATDGKFEGFALGGGSIVFDDTLLLIEPGAALAYQDANRPKPQSVGVEPAHIAPVGPGPDYPAPANTPAGGLAEANGKPPALAQTKAKSFFGAVEIPAATAKMKLVQIADEIVSALASDPNANIRVTVDISSEFADGASDGVKRAVSENARSLGLKTADWE
jgi:hypothetical protein